MEELVVKAKLGSLIPLAEQLSPKRSIIDYFSVLTKAGTKKHSLLVHTKTPEPITIAVSDPALLIESKGAEFSITALNLSGQKILAFVKKDFGFCHKTIFKQKQLYGHIVDPEKGGSKTIYDILHTIANKFSSPSSEFPLTQGMVACGSGNDNLFAYFFDQFLLDYKGSTHIIANAIVTDSKRKQQYADSVKAIKQYKKAETAAIPKPKKAAGKKSELISDKEANDEQTNQLINDLIAGKIVYGAAASTHQVSSQTHPFSLVSDNKELFYVSTQDNIGISSDSYAQVNVTSHAATVTMATLHTIHGDDTARAEAALRLDPAATASHLMLVDAVKDDLLSVSPSVVIDSLMDLSSHQHALSMHSSLSCSFEKKQKITDVIGTLVPTPPLASYPRLSTTALPTFYTLLTNTFGYASATPLIMHAKNTYRFATYQSVTNASPSPESMFQEAEMIAERVGK